MDRRAFIALAVGAAVAPKVSAGDATKSAAECFLPANVVSVSEVFFIPRDILMQQLGFYFIDKRGRKTAF